MKMVFFFPPIFFFGVSPYVLSFVFSKMFRNYYDSDFVSAFDAQSFVDSTKRATDLLDLFFQVVSFFFFFSVLSLILHILFIVSCVFKKNKIKGRYHCYGHVLFHLVAFLSTECSREFLGVWCLTCAWSQRKTKILWRESLFDFSSQVVAMPPAGLCRLAVGRLV